jgi:hypothetical protein
VSENHEAQALARWLEEHPGQAPPADVDPEVLEALYALRPDLAPAPSFSIEDVLDTIESGPFARRDEAGGVVSLAAERARRGTHDAAAASQPPAAKRRVPWWAAPGVGALAAAAIALVVILPTAGILLTRKGADTIVAKQAQEVAAPAAAPSPAGTASPEQPAANEPAPQRESLDEGLRQEESKRKSDGTVGADGSAGGLAAPAEPAKPATIAAPLEERDAEAPQDLDAGYRALEKAAGAKLEESAPAKELETLDAGATTAPGRSDDRAKDARSAPAPSAAAEAAGLADEPSSGEPEPYGGISSSSTDAALVAATDDSDDRTAMTAAWFLAKRQYDRGDPDAAMATIVKGLRRAGNDDLRSDLTALQWTVAQAASPPVLDAAPATER